LRALLDLPGTLRRVHEGGAGAVRLDVGPYPVAYVARPESVRSMLDTRVTGLAERGRFFEDVSRVIGTTSLVTCAGAEHGRLRRLLAPAFRPEQVAAYAATMVATTTELQRAWEDGEPLVVDEAMSRLTLEVAARALLGLKGAAELDDFGAVLDAGTRVFYRLVLPRRLADVLWSTRLSGANRRLFAARSRVDAFVRSLLEERATRSGGGGSARRSTGGRGGEVGTTREPGAPPPNLLDVLLAARDDVGEPLRHEELRDQIVTFLFAGNETTAQALTWTFVELARHPEVERALLDELDEVLGGRSPMPEDAARVRYTRAVVRETLRLWPPAWFLSREATSDTTIEGCPLRRGTLVLASPLALHRDGAYWDDPERFDPDRWLDENAEARAHPTYLPFGYGRRNCIGSTFALTEMVLVVATVCAGWRVRVVEPDRIEPKATVTLRPRSAVHARLERRR